MPKELVGNTGGVCNNSDLRSDGDATLPGSSGDARGSHKNSRSHRSANEVGAAEFSNIDSMSQLSLNAKDFVGGGEKSKSPSDASPVISVGGGEKSMSSLLSDDEKRLMKMNL